MKSHTQMDALVARAASALLPALPAPLVGPDGTLDVDALLGVTTTLSRLMQMQCGAASAVYITWDTRGICRYVGSVHRPHARTAVRSRMREHLRHSDRRAVWYGVTVLPVRVELGDEIVRECEGRVARHLCPIEGTHHPIPSNDLSLDKLIALRLTALG